MVRGYLAAYLAVVLLACIPIAGCGGSGTARLLVTTTSLPNGSVGTPYTQALAATGGTPPYTWSQASGGAMPAGVSIGNNGIFFGTPTASGTFGPYVFTVTDSNSVTANSASLSLVINSTALTVTTASLPAGTIGSLYSATLTAIGGTGPYTWTQTSGGALPPGISPVTSAGLISGTPTTVGTYGPYVFTATDSTNATASSASLSITISSAGAAACAPLGNETALNSSNPYAFLVKGKDSSDNPIVIAGSFTPNGSAGITNATVDYNGFTNGPAQLTVNAGVSAYAFGSSGQGCVYLAFSGPPAGAPTSLQLSFYLGGFDGTIYHTGRVIESDNPIGSGTRATGLIHVQTPGSFSLSALQPNYAFGVDGWTADVNGLLRTSIAGSFSNASGVLSAGYADLVINKTSTNSGPSGELTGGNGTLNSTIDPNTGRGTGTYTIPSATPSITFDFAFYVLNGSDLLLISTDSPAPVGSAPLLSGRALLASPSYAAGALNGYYLLASQGLEINASEKPTGNLVAIGTMNATSAGAIPAATIYSNDAGTYAPSQNPYSSYSVEAASGRASFAAPTGTPPVVYLTATGTPDDGIAGFLVGTDTQASSGILINQTTASPNYSVSSVSGNYAASTAEDMDGLTGTFLGLFNFSGAGGYTLVSRVIGSIPNAPNLGTIAINPDGSGALDGGNLPLVTNGTQIFALPNSGDPLLYVLTEGTVAN